MYNYMKSILKYDLKWIFQVLLITPNNEIM